MSEQQSIVHWLSDKDTQKCGYCKNTSESVQYGMWAQSLTVADYQNLIDRGWRRSGQYCYKSVMQETCCPLYTIRCEAINFHASKSQKKVIKKFNKFLNTGILKEREALEVSEGNDGSNEFVDRKCPNVNVGMLIQSNDSEIAEKSSVNERNVENLECMETSKLVKKGTGADPAKPPCKKAKQVRLEKKLKKLESSGQKIELQTKQQGKNLEEFMNETSLNDKHKLMVKLIEPTNPNSDWNKYELLEFELYKKYQSIIHNDPPHKNKLEGFLRFLVNTPLERKPKASSSNVPDSPTYGSYHQQYWLDDKLIAVGVIDILPKCVSAVYFFYDPDYRELTLGTYGSLKEIQLARQLYPTFKTEYYYMGFYIHNCQKMKYKANMMPSFLLCPETYQWFPIEQCLLKLDKSLYSRFNDDTNVEDVDSYDEDDLNNMKIVFGNKFMTYKRCKGYLNKHSEFEKIAKLIGKKCVRSMFFVVE